MYAFLGFASLIGFFIALVFLIINLIIKRSKKKPSIALGVCFVLFVIAVVTTPEQPDSESTNTEKVKEEQQYDEKIVTEKGKITEEKIVTEEEKITEEEMATEEKEKANEEKETTTNEDQETNENIKTDVVKKEESKERRKLLIKYLIQDRVNDGDYGRTELKKITINENLGTDIPDDYIALVYFNFNVMNPKNTGNSVMRMYSDDLAATLAKRGVEDVAEIAIFWDDNYNNRKVKYAYEYREGAFYVMDIAGE